MKVVMTEPPWAAHSVDSKAVLKGLYLVAQRAGSMEPYSVVLSERSSVGNLAAWTDVMRVGSMASRWVAHSADW